MHHVLYLKGRTEPHNLFIIMELLIILYEHLHECQNPSEFFTHKFPESIRALQGNFI